MATHTKHFHLEFSPSLQLLCESRLAHALAATLLLIALSFRIWIKIEKTDVGYEIARERNAIVRLDMERRELDLKLSVVKRPDYLRREASRLGLADLQPGQAVKLREKDAL